MTISCRLAHSQSLAFKFEGRMVFGEILKGKAKKIEVRHLCYSLNCLSLQDKLGVNEYPTLMAVPAGADGKRKQLLNVGNVLDRFRSWVANQV